jgi:hypothetical protein
MRRTSRHSGFIWGIIVFSTVAFFSSIQNQAPVPAPAAPPAFIRVEAPHYYQSQFTVRIGAICRDGWESSATGRGACSHHGGVDHWLYR